MYWADRRTLGGLQAGIPAGAERALKVYAHILGAEAVWLARLLGEDWTSIAIWPELSVAECATRQAANEKGYRAYLAALDDDRMGTAIEYRNSKGDVFRTEISDVLTHVAAHGTYHRGQIATIVRAAGGESVVTDFIAFAREQAR